LHAAAGATEVKPTSCALCDREFDGDLVLTSREHLIPNSIGGQDRKPRLVAQDGETSLGLPDAVCELLLKVVGGLQQGKAISIRVAEEPTDSAS
jgi:hypothetical protein